jgi:NHL repeat
MVSNGFVTTVAGTGLLGFSGDNGPATSAELSVPRSSAIDTAGNLYIADSINNRIRRVSNGVITTVAGSGTAGFSGDNGPATNAELDIPVGVAVDAAGRVYIADSFNNRIRLLSIATSSCTYSVTPASLQASAAGGNFSVAIQTTPTCSWAVSGLPNWIAVAGTSSGSGSATITLLLAPNSSRAALSAAISIAGVALPVTQAAGPAYACTNAAPPVITSIDSASAYGGYSYFASGS